MNVRQATVTQSIYPCFRYDDAKAAIAWLTSVLGFEEKEICAGEGGTIAHAELRFGGNLIMLGSAKAGAYDKSPASLGGVTGTTYIGLDTPARIESLYAKVKAAGAHVLRELTDTEYGSREFSVCDPEGYAWSFGTYRPAAESDGT